MRLEPGIHLNHYAIAASLGVGGMGEVYRATDTKLGRDVAIKVLSSEVAQDTVRLARFEREAKLLAALNHANIAHVYGFESAPLPDGSTVHFLAMELVEGEDLAERLKRGAIPVDEALEIARQSAEALEEAHERSIIHRDLKPANIKVTPEGKVKILDFGLAKALESDPGSDSGSSQLSHSPTISRHATNAGMILGTVAYMSPEQARGKILDKRTDIWAFGVVMFEMLTSQRLFSGETVSDVLAGVLKTEIDFRALPGAVPPAIRDLLRRCLERNPKDRLRDIGDARLVLADSKGGARSEAALTGGAEHSVRRANRVTLVLAGLAVIFAALFVASLFRSSGPAPLEHVVRFPLVTDPSLAVTTELTIPFAISPDGRTVVFTARKGDAQPHLWVRSLDDPNPRELEGTEGGTQPAISPDGEWVAYLVRFNEIRKVRLSGGAATRLGTLDTIDTYSAAITWASDDEILLEVLGTAAGIQRLSAAGGTPTELIPLDAAAGETMQRVPFVLRSERKIVYQSITADDRPTLAMYSPDDGRRTRLGIEGVQALGLVDGRLIYARADGNLMAIPLDVDAMQVTGPALELREVVASSEVGTRVALSEAGTLVYRAGSAASRLVVLDENRRPEPLGKEVGAFAVPRFSPDGRRIVVGLGGERFDSTLGRASDLWVFDRDSGQTTRLTRAGTASAPEWTPDGRRLAFIQRAQRRGEIWILPLDGSAEASRLVDVEGDVKSVAVAPDGRSLVAVRYGAPGRLIWMAVGSGAQATDLRTASSQGSIRWPAHPRISPDGRLVAFADQGEVYVRPLEGAGILQATDNGGSSPAWGPDSRHLYFANGNVLRVAELRTAPTLGIANRRIVAQLAYPVEDFDVSPDGKTFVLVAPISSGSNVQVAVHWVDELRRTWRQNAPAGDAP